MKKVLAFTLALTLAFGTVALPAVEGGVTFDTGISASAEETSDGFEYEINDDETVTITGYNGNGGNVTIPDTIDGMKVTSIGNSAFYGYSNLTSITIPDSVTSIGDCAFDGCKSLTSVTIPDGITSIGDTAFYGCSSLTNIKIPDGVTDIGRCAFYDCSSLTSITIPKSVTSIGGVAFDNTPWLANKKKINPLVVVNGILIDGSTASGKVVIPGTVKVINDYAFQGCYNEETGSYESNITSVTIPDGVTSIGNSAFRYCKSLTSVTIPDSVTNIGDSAFDGCSSLTNIKIPDGVTSIGHVAFSCCFSLTSVTIPDSVTSIGGAAFKWCSNLTSVTIPDSVTSIGDYAFDGCSSLTSITIPNSVTSIGCTAFDGCSSLTDINVDSNNKKYSSKDGVLFNKNKTGLIRYPIGNTRKSYTIPDSVTSIDDYAFYGCSSLTSVTIPESVTSIGDYTFQWCSSLTSVTISDSVTSIGDSAFSACSSLKDIYYTGTKEQWDKISIGYYNGNLGNANIHYNSTYHTHSYTSKITKQPTCTATGVKTFTCSCGDKYTEKIPAKGHKYTTKVVKPTCTAKGYTLHTCSVCKKSYKDNYKNAIGHKYVKVKVVKPTLKSQGYTLYKCSTCGATIKKNYVPALVSITKAKITGIKDTTYTGKQIKPAIKVVIGKTTLKNGRDYTVSYGKNKTVGKGTVTIIGKGKYGGKITKSFKILPAKTSAKLSSTKGKIKVTLKKAKGAKKYQIQYATNKKFKGAKKITTTATKKSFKAKSKKIYYVRVRSVNGKYVSGWSAVKKIKVK